VAEVTLGIDIGANSIGWALIDRRSRRIVATGVRVFPEGVENYDTKKEQPKMESRRLARGMRRQIARRRARKLQLLKVLEKKGLLPADLAERTALDNLNPYELRRRALSEALTPFEFGRLLVHLNQRRGFKSNRKSDRGKKADDKGILGEMNALSGQIATSGCPTLGVFLAELQKDPHARIRGRHTRREMLEKEFELCWSKQESFHSKLLTSELEFQVRRIVFYQRPMYWPASVVGRCELEPRQPRCERADRLAQKFRLLQEVNNLKYFDPDTREEKGLDREQRTLLLDKLSKSPKMDFEKIRKELGFIDSISFNLERGERKSLKGMPTDCALLRIFGKAWNDFPESRKNEIVRSLIEADDDKLLALAAEWGLAPESVENLASVEMPDGYSSLSRVALEKLIPHMERGLLYMTDDQTPSALTAAGYLRPDQMPRRMLDHLPEPPDIANPVVRQAMFELRKVVNAIIREYGKPELIHVELARDATMSAEQRQKASSRRQDNEDSRSEAAELIRGAGFKVSRDGIDRVLLWKEQGGRCAYSGQSISLTQLLQGEADIDHILPRSRCLDDSMANKVVAMRLLNQEKGNRTPREWLESDSDRYNRVLQGAALLPYPKRKRFTQKELELDKFVSRQLNDTRYISREAAKYLRHLVREPHHVLCLKGSYTAELRRHWGLNSVLRELSDSPAWAANANLRDGEKDRSDHRHHAIDAIVIALTDQSRLQELARIQRDGGTETTGEVLSEPWESFRPLLVDSVRKIQVSHHVQRKVSGALHADTIYGRVWKGSPSGDVVPCEGKFVVRKAIAELTRAMVEDVRDEVIREIVKARLNEREEAFGRGVKGGFPKGTWIPELAMASGIPIRKVRINVAMGANSVASLPGARAVAKSGNHHVEIFKERIGNGRFARVVSTFDAARRLMKGEPVIDRTPPPGFEFLMSLSINEMLLVDGLPAEKSLHRVQKMDVNGSIILRPHTYAGRAKGTDKPPLILRRSGSTLRGKKVTVDPIGRIRWAND
jgi:CRISPR-associated endonuclease Csn1